MDPEVQHLYVYDYSGCHQLPCYCCPFSKSPFSDTLNLSVGKIVVFMKSFFEIGISEKLVAYIALTYHE